MTEIFTVTTILLIVAAAMALVASAFISSYAAWMRREKIPAIRSGRPAAAMPWSARVGRRLVGSTKK